MSSNNKEENAGKTVNIKMSKFCLIPLPHKEKKIPLKEGNTEVGRRTLTEELGITSQTHPKKMSVSRVQVALKTYGDNITLKSIGLNTIQLTIRGMFHIAEKERMYVLNVGDSFTLCGSHFPFAVGLQDGQTAAPSKKKVKPKEKEKVKEKAKEKEKEKKVKPKIKKEDGNLPQLVDPAEVIPMPDLSNLDAARQAQILQFYYKSVELYKQQHRQLAAIEQMKKKGLKRETVYEEEEEDSRANKKQKHGDHEEKQQLKLHRHWSVGVKVEIDHGGKRKQGTVTAYDDDEDEYEVTCEDRSVSWHRKATITVLPQKSRKTASLSRSQSNADLSGRSSSPSSDDSKDDDDSSDDSSGSSDASHDSDDSKRNGKSKKSRRTRRARTAVAYFEWPSESSSEGSGSDEASRSASRAIRQTAAESKPKTRKTNWTRIEHQISPTHQCAVLYSDVCLKHYVPRWHLERPSRVSQIMDGIRHLQKHFPSKIDVIEDFPKVTRDVLVMVHDESYINKMESQKPETDAPQHATQYSIDDQRVTQDCDTFMSLFSFEAALTAAGAVCKAVDLVTQGKYRTTFCCIRPPGHHCGKKGHTAEASSQGYCIINNVAIGAFYATSKLNYKRVAVVDFDVHHGNGTEEILQNDNHYLFVSVHVGEIYPGTGGPEQSRASNVLNISLQPKDESQKFRRAVDTQIVPALEKFQPELLLLSSGFDGHKNDPTDDGLLLEEADYAYITEKMLAVADKHCQGKIVSVLEGGYNLPALRKCAREHVLGLIKKAPSEKITTVNSIRMEITETQTEERTSFRQLVLNVPPPTLVMNESNGGVSLSI